MSQIINRYDIQHADELRALDIEEKTRNYLPHKELLELVQSTLEEPKVDSVSVDSLNSVEDQLEVALSITRARKSELMLECVKNLQEKEKMMIEENHVLASQVTNAQSLLLLEAN
ncbi:unnamed protein product [Thlaspi arvense]|uniref:K-box domain-containing protein n=1 Tax=Thlaspi arvense TaxID=13288 RepID=A0AAU9RI76_THLAR|nr:unnamed protein product [Thlaspi arvense]